MSLERFSFRKLDMNYVRMGVALTITAILILKINNNKKLLVPVSLIYFFITVLNDMFAMSVLELANIYFSYQLADMLMLVYAGVLLLDIFRYPMLKVTIIDVFTLFILILVILSATTGIVQYGPTSEWIGDLRTFGLFLLSILCFTRFFNVDYIKQYLNFIDIIMGIIAFISFILWILDIGFGFHPLLSQYNATLSDGGSTMRFVQPYQVFGIAIYALYLIRKDIQNKHIIGFKALLYVIIVILFQHRSIWLGFALGVATILFDELFRNGFSKALMGELSVFVILLLLLLLFGKGSIVNNITNSLGVAIRMFTGGSLENTTANTRVLVWNAVKDDLSGVYTLVGRPFGYGYAYSIGWVTSPHGGYIRMLGRTGYLGMVSLILLLVCIFSINTRQRRIFSMEFLVFTAAFMYGYDFTWLCGVVIGSCLCMLRDEQFIEYDNVLD